VNVFV
jgi:hypothetical protein